MGHPPYIGLSQGCNTLGTQPSMIRSIYHIHRLDTYYIVIATQHYFYLFLCLLEPLTGSHITTSHLDMFIGIHTATD